MDEQESTVKVTITAHSQEDADTIIETISKGWRNLVIVKKPETDITPKEYDIILFN